MGWDKLPSAFTKIVEGDVNRAMKRASFIILRRLTVVSPVDTGLFRGNWQVGISFPPREQIAAIRSGPATFALGRQVIEQQDGFKSIWISNNLPYGESLNAGHSGQAPRGFVQAAVFRGRDFRFKGV